MNSCNSEKTLKVGDAAKHVQEWTIQIVSRTLFRMYSGKKKFPNLNIHFRITFLLILSM